MRMSFTAPRRFREARMALVRVRSALVGAFFLIALFAVLLVITPIAGSAQSSSSQSSPQTQSPQKPDQVPDEAGGPGGEVGPMAVPRKTKESSDATPPPPKPKKQADIPEYSLRVDVPVVTVDARVMMKDGRPLALPPNVAKEHFRVWEDGVPQKIQSVTQSEAPITAVLLVEFASKNYNFLYDALNSSYMFASNLKPIDWVAVIEFDMKSHILVDFTQDKQAIFGALNTLRIPGFSETNLWDAMYDTLDRLHEPHDLRQDPEEGQEHAQCHHLHGDDRQCPAHPDGSALRQQSQLQYGQHGLSRRGQPDEDLCPTDGRALVLAPFHGRDARDFQGSGPVHSQPVHHHLPVHESQDGRHLPQAQGRAGGPE